LSYLSLKKEAYINVEGARPEIHKLLG